MTQTAKVVIVMATYNGTQFLGKQIESIQAQTYQNWALLIHDDGSTDETVALIQRYHAADPRVQLASNQGHLGIKRGFMETLTLAEGDYYAFSDQDDIWHADKLARLVQELDGINKPALAYSKFQEIDANDQDITDESMHTKFVTEFSDFLFTNTVTGCTCLFNSELRDVLISVLENFDYSSIHMHDWWAALVASAIGEVHFVDERLISYRQHGNNVLGAPTHTTHADRIKRILKFSERKLILASVSQAKLVRALYKPLLSPTAQVQCDTVSDLFFGYHPIQKWNQLANLELVAGPRFLMIEVRILLYLPTVIRKQILKS